VVDIIFLFNIVFDTVVTKVTGFLMTATMIPIPHQPTEMMFKMSPLIADHHRFPIRCQQPHKKNKIEAPGTLKRRKTTNNDEAVIYCLSAYQLL
jgi:hypothetical protein